MDHHGNHMTNCRPSCVERICGAITLAWSRFFEGALWRSDFLLGSLTKHQILISAIRRTTWPRSKCHSESKPIGDPPCSVFHLWWNPATLLKCQGDKKSSSFGSMISGAFHPTKTSLHLPGACSVRFSESWSKLPMIKPPMHKNTAKSTWTAEMISIPTQSPMANVV